MKLKSARIVNYRNIEDSGEFSVGPLTCLVGKNEAGKTSVLTALEKIRPVGSAAFAPKLDYPRRNLITFEKGDASARVAVTEWQLEKADIQAVEEALVPGCVTGESFNVTHRYGSPGMWEIPFDHKKMLSGLLDAAHLNAAEKGVLTACANTKALHEKLSGLQNRSDKQTALMETIGKYREQSANLCAIDVLSRRMPKFLYFSNYNRMAGAVSFDKIKHKVDNREKLGEGESIFLDFLAYAGVSLEDIEKLTEKEGLMATLESASASVTEKMFEYWSQNQNLAIKFDIRNGMPNDPPPLNSGKILDARVWNDLHKMTVDFSERSAGFVWFFSFIVHFSQVKKEHGSNLIILLDEPGLSLHGKAQADLLRYIRKELLPHHQVLYTTHSPFMIPTDNWDAVKTVEDVVQVAKGGKQTSIGAKVSEDALMTTPDTMFPLQGALGYEITQSLFIGANVLLVEGASDLRYLQTASSILRKAGKVGLSEEWTICPVGGIGNIRPFVSLFSGENKLRVAALTDYAKGVKRQIEQIRESAGLSVHTYAEFCGKNEADVEDVFGAAVYAQMVNNALGLKGKNALSEKDFDANARVVKEVNRLLPKTEDELDHYAPAEWLARNPDLLDQEIAKPALERFEGIFQIYNDILKRMKGESA